VDIQFGRFEFSDIDSPGIKKYYDFWKQKCSDRLFPSSKDIDFNDVPEVTPYLYFTEIHYFPLRLFFTFVGSLVVEYEESDFNAVWMHEIDEDDWERVDKLGEINAAKLIMRKKAPVFGRDEAHWIHHQGGAGDPGR